MYSLLRVINLGCSVLSIEINDEEVIPCLLPYEISNPKKVIYPSTRSIIKNGNERVVFDLLLPIEKEASHTLIVCDTSFLFI